MSSHLKTVSSRSKGKAGWNVESFAERVFMTYPRLFSFSHRVLASVRHPYLAVLIELVDANPQKGKNRVEELLGALLESREEERKWSRVGAMFDLKLTAEEVDNFRRKVFLHSDVKLCIEVIWAALGGVVHGFVKEEEYKNFHYKLYSHLLKIDNVSVVTSTSTAVMEDFSYDRKGEVGVSFGSFAVSMLELADNWTNSRRPEDFVQFLKGIGETCLPVKQRKPSQHKSSSKLANVVYFSGGLICETKINADVKYHRVNLP